MAKKFAFATYDRKHLKNLLRRAKDISSLFSDAAREGARIGEATGYTDPNGEFAFDKFPTVKQRVEELFRGLHDQLLLTVTEGNREEWLLSAAKNDALVESKYSRAVAKLGDRAEAWTEPHLEALEQFNKRKERGMNLSDRVWRLTDQFKGELELALEMGLGDGKSAAALSRDVREYLNEPHKLFRRVRNEKGQLRLSKAAAAYHPGQGVYRSSYKNALRLTATENNIAYRTADHERWNDLDFVIGIEIMLSNNHPIEDICDEMCGVYPKTFKFVGWHPFCRCIAVPKLADEDEFIARQQALIDGEELPQGGYSGEVTEMPQGFVDWVSENTERVDTAKTEPYFLADNTRLVKLSKWQANEQEWFEDGNWKYDRAENDFDIRGEKRDVEIFRTRGGMEIVVPSNVDVAKQLIGVDDIAQYFNALPPRLQATTDRVVLYDKDNPDDEYWRKVYKGFTRSFATGGPGVITFYANSGRSKASVLSDAAGAIAHESGHNYDYAEKRLRKNKKGIKYISDSDEWQAAMEADAAINGKKSPTTYGENAACEDFADSIRTFYENEDYMREHFPNRSRLLLRYIFGG